LAITIGVSVMQARPSRTDIGGDGGEFVFHLDEQCANFRRTLGETLGGFRRRRNGIAGKKPATGSQRAFGKRMVAIHEMRAGIDPFGICCNSLHFSVSPMLFSSTLFTKMENSGQISWQNLQSVQASGFFAYGGW
jgi:hypothetical protein